MRLTTLFLVFLASATVAAQEARVYTNKDLVQGRAIARKRTVTPEELRGLEERQFKFQPPLPNGPRVVGVWSSPTAGPFGEFPHYREPWNTGLRLYDYSWGVTPYVPYVPVDRVASPGRRDHRGSRQVNRPAGRRR
jgi:hypothetical protein